jgi:GntR family transcriptional regulator
MTDLDPSTTLGMPLYKEVARRMLSALSAGEWQPGGVIPAEKKLGERFAVSIGTVRKAIDELVAENILIRHQGRGTFVATHNKDQHLYRFFNVLRHDGLKSYPEVELVSFSKGKADKIAAAKLSIPSGAKTFHFSNVLSLNNEPVIVDEITLPENLFRGFTEQKLRDRPNTLYNLYQREFGVNVIRIEERLRCGLASDEHARLLQLAAGAPLLEIHRVAFSFNQQAIEWRVSYVNTEKYEYYATGTQ